jgi:hypothetical protein
MECDICSRTSSSNLPFHCITCARNVIYGPRLEATRLLLEKESLATRIEKAVNTRPTGSEKQDKKSRNEDISLSQVWYRETAQTRKAESEGKAEEIDRHILTLREEIQNARDEICKRKAALAGRKRDLESIRTSLPGRRTAITNRLVDSMRKGSRSWSGINIKSIDTRAFLCREAALLYGLGQRKKAKGAVVIDQFSIGGLPLVDLKEINGKLIASRGI